MPTSILRHFLPALSVCLLVVTASGQSSGGKPKRPTAPALTGARPAAAPPPAKPAPAAKPSHNPGVVEFGEDPLKIESIGLTMPLPLGCIAQIDTAGHDVGARIAPKDASWAIRIGSPRGTADMTTAQVGDAAIVTLLESYGITDKDSNVLGTRGRMLTREPQEGDPPILISGKPADRWYVTLPPLEGRQPVVRGFTVIQTGPGQFITFELLTTEADLARTKPIYQTTVAAATIEDPTLLAAARAGALTAGLKVFDNLGTQAIRDIIATTPERWERLYRPSPTGSVLDEVEVAYRRIKFSVGNRGALNPAERGSADRQEGFVVEMDARLIDGTSIIDSRSVYFMSFDREDEAWVVTNAFRIAGSTAKPPVFRETGGRTKSSMMVRVEGTGKPPETIRPSVPGEGYISQVEAAMLPQLLLRHAITAEYGFYAYQSSANTIRMRRDILERVTDAESGRPDHWKLITRLSEDKPPQTVYFTDKGVHLRTEMPDGSFWEPTNIEALAKLWKSKGLPVN